MQYFKNIELAKLYRVSKSTVAKWIEGAQQGKLELTLYSQGDKVYIAKTLDNLAIVERIVKEGRKYRNSRTVKSASPQPGFYKIYTYPQIYDMIKNIEVHKELPVQYAYFGKGADDWNKYISRLIADPTPNLLSRTIELFERNQDYIDSLLSKYKRVNVIDIGVGNALPVKGFLTHLLEEGIMGRYIALDVSPAMLDLAVQNVNKWFDGQIAAEAYEFDVSFERFSNLVAQDYLESDPDSTINLVLFLGGLPGNLRYPDDAFRAMSESMNKDDILIYIDKLENDKVIPQWLDRALGSVKKAFIDLHGTTLELMNLKEPFYDIEIDYDPTTKQRLVSARLKFTYTLKIDVGTLEYPLEFKKDDKILLWRSWQFGVAEVVSRYERTGLYMLHASQTEDHEYILSIAQVNRD